MPQDAPKNNAYDIYRSVRDRIDTEKLDAVEFATSLINVSKIEPPSQSLPHLGQVRCPAANIALVLFGLDVVVSTVCIYLTFGY